MGGFAAAGTLGLFAEYFLKTTAVLTLALLAAAASRRRPNSPSSRRSARAMAQSRSSSWARGRVPKTTSGPSPN